MILRNGPQRKNNERIRAFSIDALGENKMNKKTFSKNRLAFHLMLLVPVVLAFIFYYIPMGGIVLAFQDYKPGLGLLHSKWVGFENFRYLFQMPEFKAALRNTLFIAVIKILLNLVIPIGFALLMNELRCRFFKKTVQTLTFIPYFLSWVILGGILIDFLSSDGGMLNSLITSLGSEKISFLGNKNVFPYTVIVSDVWKNLGYNTIVYLAAMTGIDQALYEASAIDGAGRWKQTLHITLPSIAPFIALMTILALGNVLNAGFDQIFNLYNASVYETGDIIDTLVYRLGMLNRQYSLSTAVGLFKSAISMILILVSYKFADKYAGYRVF